MIETQGTFRRKQSLIPFRADEVTQAEDGTGVGEVWHSPPHSRFSTSQHRCARVVKKPADPAESEWLQQARAGDPSAFDQLMKPYRKPQHTHCYRMLGSPFDADDALRETLLGAWRGLRSFEACSSLGACLNSIATRICLRMISKPPRRRTSTDLAAPLLSTAELGEPVQWPVLLEPMLDNELLHKGAVAEDPAAIVFRREYIGLAFVSMLQHLLGMQRAVLLLRVLGRRDDRYPGTTVASVNSALQRSRQTVRAKKPAVQSSCQTACKTDPLSASNFDPPSVARGGQRSPGGAGPGCAARRVRIV